MKKWFEGIKHYLLTIVWGNDDLKCYRFIDNKDLDEALAELQKDPSLYNFASLEEVGEDGRIGLRVVFKNNGRGGAK